MFKKYKETGIFDKHEIYPYITEGIGEDFLPKNVDFDVIDHFEKVTDKDAAIMTRRIAREEGIFAGNSAGSAMAGLLQLQGPLHRRTTSIVVIFHDHGSRYLGKMFNDDWMREKGFLEKTGMTARDLVATRLSGELLLDRVRTSRSSTRCALMSEHDFSQISITRDNRLVGSLNETHLYDGAGARPRRQDAAGRVDHAAGVSVRRRLDAGRAAGDDDHAAEPGGAGARLQDRQDVHHHALGRDPRAVLRRAASVGLLVWLVVAAGGLQARMQPPPSTSRAIAMTFDDLPGVLARPTAESLADINRRLLATLRIAGAPAIGFVNEGRLDVDGERDERTAILRSWVDAGMALGNHSYNHEGFNDATLADYEADVLRGERVTRPLLDSRGKALVWSRHPFNQTGPTLDAKTRFEAFAREHGYRIAPFTVEATDYLFTHFYKRPSAIGSSRRPIGS